MTSIALSLSLALLAAWLPAILAHDVPLALQLWRWLGQLTSGPGGEICLRAVVCLQATCTCHSEACCRGHWPAAGTRSCPWLERNELSTLPL